MEKLQDPTWGNQICWSCVVYHADHAKGQIDRFTKYWEEHGGEAGKEQHFEEMGEKFRQSYLKSEALRDVEWRVFIEIAEANNRTCKIVNYFKCPYGEKRQEFIENGLLAEEIWQHIYWYDIHWNEGHTFEVSPSESKWYHYGEPALIDVTSVDDIVKAMEDDRFDKIIEEHERYMKETGREIWAL